MAWSEAVKSSGERALLIADRERSLERWGLAGRPDEFGEDLRARVPAVVSGADLMRVLMRSGQPCRDVTYGGVDWGKTFPLRFPRLLVCTRV